LATGAAGLNPDEVKVLHRPRLLSDKGPSYVSKRTGQLAQGQGHPPMSMAGLPSNDTGNIERYHRSMKNRILFENEVNLAAMPLGDPNSPFIKILDRTEHGLDRKPTSDILSDEAFLDRETRIEERIDAKIDSDIKGLGQTKAMKAIGIGKPRVATPTKPLEQIDSPAQRRALYL
jgi:hypothetical protein